MSSRERFKAFMRDKWPDAPIDNLCSTRAWEAWQARDAEVERLEDDNRRAMLAMQAWAVKAQEQEAKNVRLVEALRHMKWCAVCAEGDWSDCTDGGNDAAALLREYTPKETQDE